MEQALNRLLYKGRLIENDFGDEIFRNIEQVGNYVLNSFDH